MAGRIAMCSFGLLVGLSATHAHAQAPIESPPGAGASCTPPAVAAPPPPCRPSLFGTGSKGLLASWFRPARSRPAVACPTCEPAPNARPAVPLDRLPSASTHNPTPAREQALMPASGWADGAARRTPAVDGAAVLPVPDAPRAASPVVLQPVPAASAPTSAVPVLATSAASPYTSFIELVQTTQEKDSRVIREMVERRQASLALIRSLQAADANTVSSLEKLLQQMKEESPRTPPADAPSLPALPAPTAGVPDGPSPKEVQGLMEQLDRLSQKVNELAGPMPHVD